MGAINSKIPFSLIIPEMKEDDDGLDSSGVGVGVGVGSGVESPGEASEGEGEGSTEGD